MPDRARAMHVSLTLERQRATMNARKQLCVCSFVHTHTSGGMGASTWNCVPRCREGEGERCRERSFVQPLRWKHSQLDREREHVLTPVRGRRESRTRG